MQDPDRVFYDRSRTGELRSVLNIDVNQLASFLTDGISSTLRLLVLVVGVVMALLNSWLAVVPILVVPVLGVFTVLFVRRVQSKHARMGAGVGESNVRLERNVGGIEVGKTEHAETYEGGRVRAASKSDYDAN